MAIVNDWGVRLDDTTTKQIIGKNGIHYEYVIPIKASSNRYYNNAVDVRSRKRFTSDWPNGKKPGQYQPIGDKSYFNFYQLKKAKQENSDQKLLEKYIRAIILKLLQDNLGD